jgi:hypothetical protein
MCFTGGYALAMAIDARLLAPVLSQPSMPMAVTGAQRRSIDCSPGDLEVVKVRCAAERLEVLGLRFKGDNFVPGERFDFLREQLGEAFVAVELEDDAEDAAALYRTCHRGGETVRRLIDCLIAAVAIKADIPVLHADSDFDVLVRHTQLRVEEP